jgi:hypothetical protein
VAPNQEPQRHIEESRDKPGIVIGEEVGPPDFECPRAPTA